MAAHTATSTKQIPIESGLDAKRSPSALSATPTGPAIATRVWRAWSQSFRRCTDLTEI
jgi:hypothetical protein